MKKILFTSLLLSLSMVSTAQSFHADAQALASTRFRAYASIGAVYRSFTGFETSINSSIEIGHNHTVSGYAGYRLYTSSNDHADGLIAFAGIGYSWHTPTAKTEIGGNKMCPVVGLKLLENYSILELKYVANTFVLSFGYRLFNHQQ